MEIPFTLGQPIEGALQQSKTRNDLSGERIQMNDSAKCPVCRNNRTTFSQIGSDLQHWTCSKCGEFELAGTAISELENRPINTPAIVSGWIRLQNSRGSVPKILSYDLDKLRALSKPTFKERADLYLTKIVKENPKLSTVFEPTADELIGITFSDDASELALIVRYFVKSGLIELDGSGQHRISAEGHIAADEGRTRRSNSNQAFVAMWFDPSMDDVFNLGIEAAILAAGYTAMVINKKEHANKIDDEIIAEIRRSAFVVADFTGHRGGVYFEAGFAMGLGLPVLWTCRSDDLSKLHFDIRQYNCIDWEDSGDLSSRLQTRIEALLGKGPRQ